MHYSQELMDKGARAKTAARKMAALSTAIKNAALMKMADALEASSSAILAANEQDLQIGASKGLTKTLLDRLMLNEARIKAMADGLRQIAALPDPVGEILSGWRRPNGLEIIKTRVPLGVIGIIYEARPNVTADAAGLCLKAGNAVILRGGSEAINSNLIVAEVLSGAAQEAGVPQDAIQLIATTDREAVDALIKLNRYIDVIIPRGGAGLIKTVVENSTVPVIETGTGVCHTFVDASADLEMALAIAFNAKVSRPAVCNAMETLLVHQDIAGQFLPRLKKLQEAGVELRGCEQTKAYCDGAVDANEDDWAAEYLDLTLAVKVVSGIVEAMDHIAAYGTRHSEAIVTGDYDNARRFQQEVDAAAVYVNASTRFTDGFEFGFGAEIGISTQKLHARGPMGLPELTSIKYLVNGTGQIR